MLKRFQRLRNKISKRRPQFQVMQRSDREISEPQWLVVEPKQEHKQTFIFLHGRGDTANSFGAGLKFTALPDGNALTEVFPNAKWVFPQAPLLAVSALSEWDTQYFQWFDTIHLRPGTEEADLQIPDLRTTVEMIHTTLEKEIQAVGAENVVLGGLSQGCASALTALLLWEGEPFSACIGMCGWLPFREAMKTAALASSSSTDEYISTQTPGVKGVLALRAKLGLPAPASESLPFQEIPIYIGHGLEDNVVAASMGKAAADCLAEMQANIKHIEYERLTHWYSPSMLSDAAATIKLSLSVKKVLQE